AVDQSRAYAVDDLVRGHVVFPPGQVEDFIITMAGLQPLYNFAAVVDDHLMEITHVIRGEEHLANTPKQNLLYAAFGWSPPIYAHIPIILNMEGKKLSKRDGATAVGDFERLGYLPEALLNFIALLGWSPGDDRERMTRSELVEAFDVDGIQKHGAKFDTVKLAWMNGEYMRHAPLDELVEGTSLILSLQPDAQALRTERAHVARVCELLRERAKTLAELVESNRYFFETGSITPDAEAVKKRAGTPEAFERLALVYARLESLAAWDAAALEGAIRALGDEMGGKAGDYIHPLRVAVTGHAVSPGIFETLEVLGRKLSLRRITEFLERREALPV
ncbi:MAG: glutamate--tRNA ligase, partial [bacterium]|nr:glutamate--tRNA ligase [bacterium]